ncbi:MAG: hypothetical protein ACREXT_11375 [Gammaproteobacteria bacterium]
MSTQPKEVPDASGCHNESDRSTALQRLSHAGVVVADYTTVVCEMLKDNADPKAQDVYAAMDIPFATQVSQLHSVFAKRQ